MYSIQGKIEGMADILFNKPLPEEIERPEGSNPGRKTKDQRLEQAERRVHDTPKGLCWPVEGFIESICAGSQKVGLKVGKGGFASYVKAGVFVEGDLLFNKKKRDYIHEHWGRVPPRTGALVLVRRPALKEGWSIVFRLAVLDNINDEQLKTALEHAGLLVGLGSWRPRYGRFRVTEWKVSKN
jgi:hypothetical protein